MRRTATLTGAIATAALLSGCGGVDWAPGWTGIGAGAAAVPDGAALYQSYCASCHGAGGQGDGPAAAGLSVPPADLTRLAQRNGGTFPMVVVMSRIDGYTQGPAMVGQGAMPQFGALLEGDTVLLDTGGGALVPTPERLVRLAEHLASLQVQ